MDLFDETETVLILIDKERDEIELIIDCPIDEDSPLPAFGAFGRSPQEICDEIQKALAEENVFLKTISCESIINPNIKKERDRLLDCLKQIKGGKKCPKKLL